MQEDILFPFSEVREVQLDMVNDVLYAIKNKKHLLAHAPTGLGKTAASLAPSIPYALKHGLKIFFLTSRHTQHHICIETLKEIKKKHGIEILSVDLIGKQWMCAQEGVIGLYSNDFMEYCKKLREENNCEFYSNTRKQSGVSDLKAEAVLEELRALSPMHSENIISYCKKEKLCPYCMAESLSKSANIIVADYFYLFSPSVRDVFLSKIGAELEKSIIILDEAHNLPSRCRSLLSFNLSTIMLNRGIKEASKFGFEEIEETLQSINRILESLSEDAEGQEEIVVDKQDFLSGFGSNENYEQIISALDLAAEEIRAKQRQSYLGSISMFMENWPGQDDGFARILTKKPWKNDMVYNLMYKCLDPSLVTKEVIQRAHSIIGMSGTLSPVEMYADLLGFDEVKTESYTSPFPKKNRLRLIVPQTTTKFTRRSEEEYKKIGKISSDMANIIPGNVLLFFPSYSLRNSVFPYFQENCKKPLIVEKQGLTKEQKQEMLNEFKKHSSKGACLLAVSTGSFGEGIDLPGDLLKGVIIVGLPLEKPSLEVKELMNYYDEKYGKGKEYGYFYPAMIKTMQNAGRCIRSATDKGAVVFLDERYILPTYYECFPEDYGVEVSKDYKKKILEFFSG